MPVRHLCAPAPLGMKLNLASPRPRAPPRCAPTRRRRAPDPGILGGVCAAPQGGAGAGVAPAVRPCCSGLWGEPKAGPVPRLVCAGGPAPAPVSGPSRPGCAASRKHVRRARSPAFCGIQRTAGNGGPPGARWVWSLQELPPLGQQHSQVSWSFVAMTCCPCLALRVLRAGSCPAGNGCTLPPGQLCARRAGRPTGSSPRRSRAAAHPACMGGVCHMCAREGAWGSLVQMCAIICRRSG